MHIGHAHLHTLGKAKEIGNQGGPNTSPEQMEISTPRLNIMKKSDTKYIQVTPKSLKQVSAARTKDCFWNPYILSSTKNTINERASLPRVYASLVAPQGGNEQ